MAKILVVGLNPAWQKILQFDSFQWGRVNRARQLTELASGKGLNAAGVLRRLKHEVWLLQVLGGLNGRKIADFCVERSIHSLTLKTETETRTCCTLIDHATGMVTELIEPFSISGRDVAKEQILNLLREAAANFDAVVYCGTVPEGMDASVYLDIQRFLRPPHSILDAVRQVPENLFREASFVKINQHEYQELQLRFPKLLDQAGPKPIFLLTDGPGTARIVEKAECAVKERRFSIPRLSGVLNPIGAGDTVSAGLADGVLSGLTVAEAFRRALAMGSASCLKLVPAEYEEADCQRILEEIREVPSQ